MSVLVGRGMLLAAVAGLLLTVWLILDQGVAEVGRAVLSIGWGLPGILLVHLLQVALSGAGWRALLRCFAPVDAGFFLTLRLIREGVNNALPVAYIGGEVVVIRLLGRRGMRTGLAAAGIVVDWTTELVSQLLFTLLGLALLPAAGYQGEVLPWLLLALAAILMVTAVFLTAQRYGLFRLLERLTERLGASFTRLPPDLLNGLHDDIHVLYAGHRRVFDSVFLHLLSWAGGTLEVGVILYCMGTPVSLDQALVMESLGMAVRSIAFAIPGGFGVQEGGFMLIGLIYGLPPENGLALSLLKRVREVLLAVPALWLWHRYEAVSSNQ